MNNPAIKVTFTSTTEFVEELMRTMDLSGLGSGTFVDATLRFTNSYIPSSLSPNIKHVVVVATVVRPGDVIQIIELRRFCGELWGIDSRSDDSTRDNIAKIHTQLKKAAETLGLRTAAGVYESVPNEPR